MADLDVVCVSYQTPTELDDFLASFREVADEVDCTLTVVNVCPTREDELVGVQGTEGLKQTTLVSWTENIGFNHACNRAATAGNAPYLALFNADTELRAGVLANCVKALQSNPFWAVVGPRQVNEHNRITSAGTFGMIDDPRMRGWNEYDNGQFSDVRDDAVHVSGSAMFWRRSIWDELTWCPVFQEAVPGAVGALLHSHHYFGETWAMAHAISHSYNVVFWGPVAMVHKWHRSSPVGGPAELGMPGEKEEFERVCQAHGIPT